MRCPNCGADVNANPRDLCANCGRWREEHYAPSGQFIGERFDCFEYQGIEPTEEQRKGKEKDLKRARAATAPGS